MKKSLLILAMLVMAAGSLTGCGKSSESMSPVSSTGPSAVDQAEVAAAVAASPEYSGEDVHQNDLDMALEDSPVGALAAIRPLHWARSISEVSRRIDIEWRAPDDHGRPTIALVTLHKRFLGDLHIAYAQISEDDTTRGRLTKPIDEHWVRRVALHRVRVAADLASSDTARFVWRLVGTSGVEVTSAEATTEIQSIRLQAGDVDTTITDPLELHRLRRLIHVSPMTPLKLTVTTGRADDTVILYRHDMRARFQNNGDGTHSLRWMTGDFAGLRHFGVNALSRGTLFDDTEPYDSNSWILPFAVRPGDRTIDPVL